jgi:hypothetical protein
MDVIQYDWASWVIAIIVLLAIYAMAFYAKRELFAIIVIVFMLTHDVPIYWGLVISIILGAVVTMLTASRKIENLGMLVTDSFLMSANIGLGVVAMFTNAKSSNSPDNCISSHVNMFIVCDAQCGSVLTNSDIAKTPKWMYVLVIAVAAAGRVFWVFAARICNAPTAGDKKQQKKLGCCYYCCYPDPSAHGYQQADKVKALKPIGNGKPMKEQDEDGDGEGDDQELFEIGDDGGPPDVQLPEEPKVQVQLPEEPAAVEVKKVVEDELV